MKIVKQLLPIVLIVACVLLLGWRCPIQAFCGIQCPGCNMTTALYYFVQGRFQEAYFFNPAFYVLLAFCIASVVGLLKNHQFLQTRIWKTLLVVTLIVWLIIWIVRMITIYPQWPMIYVEDNVLHKLRLLFH